MPMGPVGPDNVTLISQKVQEQQNSSTAASQDANDEPAEGTHELEQLD